MILYAKSTPMEEINCFIKIIILLKTMVDFLDYHCLETKSYWIVYLYMYNYIIKLILNTVVIIYGKNLVRCSNLLSYHFKITIQVLTTSRMGSPQSDFKEDIWKYDICFSVFSIKLPDSSHTQTLPQIFNFLLNTVHISQ